MRDVKAKLEGNWLSLIHSPTAEVIQELLISPAEDKHRSFIISTWLKSYRGTARKHGNQEFYDRHEPGVAESRWRECLVASDEDGFTVYAWVCGSEGRLYHVYVVPELRRLQVSNRMVERACGKLQEYARPWPYQAHARVNPYLIGGLR